MSLEQTEGSMELRHSILKDWIKKMRAVKLKKLKMKKEKPEEDVKINVFEIEEEEA